MILGAAPGLGLDKDGSTECFISLSDYLVQVAAAQNDISGDRIRRKQNYD
jgi:hypothetical protein